MHALGAACISLCPRQNFSPEGFFPFFCSVSEKSTSISMSPDKGTTQKSVTDFSCRSTFDRAQLFLLLWQKLNVKQLKTKQCRRETERGEGGGKMISAEPPLCCSCGCLLCWGVELSSLWASSCSLARLVLLSVPFHVPVALRQIAKSVGMREAGGI